MNNIKGFLSFAVAISMIGDTGCGRMQGGARGTAAPALGVRPPQVAADAAGRVPFERDWLADLSGTLTGGIAMVQPGRGGRPQVGVSQRGGGSMDVDVDQSQEVRAVGPGSVAAGGDIENSFNRTNTTINERSWIDAAADAASRLGTWAGERWNSFTNWVGGGSGTAPATPSTPAAPAPAAAQPAKESLPPGGGDFSALG